MKIKKYCVCCDDVSSFYVYHNHTHKCCDACNRLYKSNERNTRIMNNMLRIVTKITDVNKALI